MPPMSNFYARICVKATPSSNRQHDARTNQMDLRLIQTNIKHVKKGEGG